MAGDGRHYDNATDKAGDGRDLVEAEPDPCDGKRCFQCVDQRILGGGDQSTTQGQENQPQTELGRAEQKQIEHVPHANREWRGDRPHDKRTQQRRETGGRQHACLLLPANDQHHDRHEKRHAEGKQVAGQMPLGCGTADHDADTKQREETGGEQGPRFSHAEP
jgi:hypothetical protein